MDESGRPYVQVERLMQQRKESMHGLQSMFLELSGGKGPVWKGEKEGPIINDKNEGFDPNKFFESRLQPKSGTDGRIDFETVELEDTRKLGIATLGSLKQHPRISLFRKFIESWYLSYFTPDAARS